MRRRVSVALLAVLLWPSLALAQFGGGRFQGYPALDKPNTWSALQTFSAGLTVSGGNVGIGTTTPIAKFTLMQSGTTAIDGIYIGETANPAYFGRIYSQTGNGLIFDHTARITLATATFTTAGLTVSGGNLDVQTTIVNTGGNYGGAVAIGENLYVNGNVGIGTTSPASLLDLRAGDLTFSGANGQMYVQGRKTELVAVGSGISTKATTITIPADAIVYAVPVRVKTQPGGTATMTVTATTSGTAFQKGANISTATGTTDPGTKATPVNYNAIATQTITFTFDAPTTDALGEIRVDIYYATATPPTS